MKNHYELTNETDFDLETETTEIRKLLDFACRKLKLKNVVFDLVFVDKATIHEINKTYRHVDRVTDVISFALEDTKEIETEIRLLGDIYICVEKAQEQAKEYGHSFLRELAFLTIHGLLHLLGYDHQEKEEEEKMFALQEEILDEYGIRRGE